MTDKILTEAFDKLKAIEESEDPFCIGATGDTEYTEAYTEVEESVEDWAQPKSYEATDHDSGDHFALHYQDANGQEQGIIEVNGVTVAHFIVGGAGAHSAKIINDDAVVDALASLISQVTGNR